VSDFKFPILGASDIPFVPSLDGGEDISLLPVPSSDPAEDTAGADPSIVIKTEPGVSPKSR